MEFDCFFDDGKVPRDEINGNPLLGGIDDLNTMKSPLSLVMAIGNPVVKTIWGKIKNPVITYPTSIHP